MTTYQRDTVAEINTLLGTMVAGDIIEVSGGVKTGTLTNTATKNWSANPVIIRPQDRTDPPLFRQTWRIENKNGLTFSGLVWESNATDAQGWPGGSYGLWIRGCQNILMEHCSWRGTAETAVSHPGFMDAFKADDECYHITMNRCEIEHVGRDFFDFYNDWGDFTITNCRFWHPRIDQSRAHDDGPPTRHPDIFQTTKGGDGLVVRDCWFETFNGYCQGLFFTDPNNYSLAQLGTVGFRNVTVERVFINNGHWNGLKIANVSNGTYQDIVIRDFPGNPNLENTCGVIIDKRNENVTVQRVVMPRNFGGQNFNSQPSNIGDITLGTGANANIISTTAFPPGWNTNLFNETGPYSDDSGSGSTPTTMGVSDWSIGEVVVDPTYTDRYTAVVYIPPTSVAISQVGLRWSQGVVDVSAGNSTTDTFTNLPNLADGTLRRRMTSTNGGNAHTIASGGTFSDLRVYWRAVVGGPLSSASDAKSFSFIPAQGPNVTSVTLNAASYTVGQTATATVNYTLGTGTLVSVAYQWKLDGGNVGTNQSTYTTVSSGSLTCTVTVTTTVSAANRTSSASTVAPAAVPPSISAVALDKLSYVQGDTATATPTYVVGSGTLTSVTYQWFQNGVAQSTTGSQFVTSATGTLFCRVTVLTSVDSATLDSSTVQIGTPPPAAPASGSWSFVAVSEVFTGRFTGQFRFPVGSVVNQGALLGCQWSYDRVTWNNTSEVGVWTDGRRLFQLLPSSGSTNDHTVGYETTSSPVYIRIATSAGTSGASVDGLTFTGGATPPPPPVEIPAADDDDWEISDVVEAPGLTNRFTGIIRAMPAGAFADDSGWIAVQWFSSTTGQWADCVSIGTDLDGQQNWRMLPTQPHRSDHSVQYEQTMANISMRYVTASGTSLTSLTAKSFTGPEFPEPDVPAGTNYTTSGDDRMTINGVRIVSPQINRPSKIRGTIDVTTDEDGIVTVQPPALPPDADTYVLCYNRHWYSDTEVFTFDWVDMSPGKNFGTLRAVNSAGVSSVSRYFFVPDIPA